jgi:hypothetical protein
MKENLEKKDLYSSLEGLQSIGKYFSENVKESGQFHTQVQKIIEDAYRIISNYPVTEVSTAVADRTFTDPTIDTTVETSTKEVPATAE